MKDPRDTPAMRQFYRFKRQHPDCILLFRMGDFYESFDDDAVALSRTLGLTLTERTAGVPMAGMPHHQIENYLRRMIEAGFRVAVADQIQDPKDAKGVVERAVTRVVTPGTLVDEGLLTDDAVSTLAAVCFLDAGDEPEGRVAVATADLSTGRFLVFDCRGGGLVDELARRSVTEVLYAETADGSPPARIKRVIEALGVSGAGQPAWYFRKAEATEALRGLYGVATLEGFGLSDDDPALSAAGALVRYLQLTQTAGGENLEKHGFRAPTLAHLSPPMREETAGECLVDATSLRSLEVVRTMRTGEMDGSLLGIFTGNGRGGARTPMGKRLLREWLCRPLSDLERIRARHRAVATFVEGRATAEALGEHLCKVQDVARIGGRVALRRASPRDLVALGRSLGQVREIAAAVEGAPALAAQREVVAALIEALSPLAARIVETCVEAPPGHLREGGLVRDGVDAELDECRLLKRDASSWLAKYQKELIEAHDLPSLKVGYNKVFGYYIELPAAQARRAPDAFSRKQTLKNAERYITPALKEFEEKVTTADARAVEREQKIFNDLCDAAAAKLGAITRFADAVAELDVLLAFADKAAHRAGRGGWIRPAMVEAPALFILQGRHPVLDERLEEGFVPNDLTLGCCADDAAALAVTAAAEPNAAHELKDGAGPSLALITGPNMAGKSTYIRQNALLVLLAHAGSFIPAERAVIGVTDRLFTRVGADDALHAGQSTFMVEMTETARILNHATERSLVILDEIGRGTSTLDGLSLAWAIAEHLAGAGDGGAAGGAAGEVAGGGEGDPSRLGEPCHREPCHHGPRTLFATHYHELTDLEERLPGRVCNLHVAVREWGDDIVFLHRILPGPTDQSYGIHVAKLAGVPRSVTARADGILRSLAVHHHAPERPGSAAERGGDGASANGAQPRGHGARIDARNIPEAGQLPLFTEYIPHPVVDRLREVKIESMSPLEAFEALRRLAEEAR